MVISAARSEEMEGLVLMLWSRNFLTRSFMLSSDFYFKSVFFQPGADSIYGLICWSLDLGPLHWEVQIIIFSKAYPVYDHSYKEHLQVIRNFLAEIDNLQLIGRNGIHKYNNTDHSMLTAVVTVKNIIKGNELKENIWQVNTEEEYHEE